jgi:hypothetical protein
MKQPVNSNHNILFLLYLLLLCAANKKLNLLIEKQVTCELKFGSWSVNKCDFYSTPFFCLDAKETKNQGWISFFTLLKHEKPRTK